MQFAHSVIPASLMANTASPSGRFGASTILATLCSPFPFLKYTLMVMLVPEVNLKSGL